MLSTNDFVNEYWGRTGLGQVIMKSGYVSESDLIFLIPNNVKKTHGLPLTRVIGKQKRKRKRRRKQHILAYKSFNVLTEIIESRIKESWKDDDFFSEFIDIKNYKTGVQSTFVEKII